MPPEIISTDSVPPLQSLLYLPFEYLQSSLLGVPNESQDVGFDSSET